MTRWRWLPPPARRGRVLEQVGQHVPQPVRVHLDDHVAGGEVRHHLGPNRQRLLLREVAQPRIEGDAARRRLRGTPQVEQAAREPPGPRRERADLGGVFPGRVELVGPGVGDEVRQHRDGVQRVVQLVREAGDGRADGGEPLEAKQLEVRAVEPLVQLLLEDELASQPPASGLEDLEDLAVEAPLHVPGERRRPDRGGRLAQPGRAVGVARLGLPQHDLDQLPDELGVEGPGGVEDAVHLLHRVAELRVVDAEQGAAELLGQRQHEPLLSQPAGLPEQERLDADGVGQRRVGEHGHRAPLPCAEPLVALHLGDPVASDLEAGEHERPAVAVLDDVLEHVRQVRQGRLAQAGVLHPLAGDVTQRREHRRQVRPTHGCSRRPVRPGG